MVTCPVDTSNMPALIEGTRPFEDNFQQQRRGIIHLHQMFHFQDDPQYLNRQNGPPEEVD